MERVIETDGPVAVITVAVQTPSSASASCRVVELSSLGQRWVNAKVGNKLLLVEEVQAECPEPGEFGPRTFNGKRRSYHEALKLLISQGRDKARVLGCSGLALLLPADAAQHALRKACGKQGGRIVTASSAVHQFFVPV